MSADLRGVLIPAVTPFDPATGDVDIVALRGNVRAWAAHAIRGVVIGGSTGEALLLDWDERLRLLEATRDVLPVDRVLVAGTGLESTRGTIRLCKESSAAGADVALVQPPAFYRGAMTPGVLRDHYEAVADASPIPLIVYQVPLRLSTLDLPNQLIGELSGHPNIIAVKDSRGDLDVLGSLLDQVRDGFQVLMGNGALLYAALELGAVGGILAVANYAPSESVALHQAFLDGRTSEAGRIQEHLAPAHMKIVGGMGVPGVKAAVDLIGLRGGGPRPPLKALGDSDRDAVRRILIGEKLLAA